MTPRPHRFPGGQDLSDLALERVVDVEGVLVDCRGAAERAIGPEVFEGVDVRGRAVLVATGWDEHWGTPAYLSDNPFLTGAAAQWLIDAGAALIGIDSLNLDSLARSAAACPHRDPRPRHPAGGAPDRPWRPAGYGLALLRRPAAHPRHGHVPRPSLRDPQLTK